VIRHLQAELLDGAGAVLGEGPAWDTRTDELVWVDILSGRVFVSDAEGKRRTTYEIDGHVSSALPAATEAGWLLTVADGFAFLDGDAVVCSVLSVEGNRPEIRFNDAKCDPAGQAVAGTMRYDERPGSAALYRLQGSAGSPPITAHRLLDHLGLANGLGWSGDGLTLYFVDSLARTLVSYRYACEGPALGPGLPVVAFDPADGMPDGMCVDVEGYLWVALYGGGAVKRFRPDGQLDTVVALPVPHVTSVCFGGVGGDRLFITTAGGGGRPDPAGIGGLWAVDPETKGRPATLWRPLAPLSMTKGTGHG
jgi:sugar lactone lactonase YvrE